MTLTFKPDMRPEPDVMLEMPTPRFHKYRRAINLGVTAFQRSRAIRLARAEFAAVEKAKMAKFIRNCAVNDRIETMGW